MTITKEKLGNYLRELLENQSSTAVKHLTCKSHGVIDCKMSVITNPAEEKIFVLELELDDIPTTLSANEVNGLLKGYSSAGYSATYSKGRRGAEDTFVINLVSEEYVKTFEIFIYQILEDLARYRKDAPVDVIMRTLADFQQFFAAFAGKKMSKEKIVGLWGELFILKSLLVDSEQSKYEGVLESWQGPERGDQDFISDDKAIEVKCSPTAKKTVKIAGLNQLNCSSLDKLILAVVQVKNDSNDDLALSLFEIIVQIRQMLQGGPILDIFNAKIQIVGYSDQHEEYYSADKYLVENTLHFEIKEDTPVLHPGNVPSPPITSARYTLDISSPEMHPYITPQPESYRCFFDA